MHFNNKLKKNILSIEHCNSAMRINNSTKGYREESFLGFVQYTSGPIRLWQT